MSAASYPAWTTRARGNTPLQVLPANWFLYTAPVGTFETHKREYAIGISATGVSEMGGNVREWWADGYGPYTGHALRNPTGPETGTSKVLRGGCWRGRSYGVMTRCSYRHHHHPDYYVWGTTGLRVAADGT